MSIMKKKNTAGGLIAFTPLKSEGNMADVREATGRPGRPPQPGVRPESGSGCVRAGEREEASPSDPQTGAKQDRVSHTSFRQLQELERFLSHRDITELRRRELLHKRWTERIWLPLQRRVEEHVSSRSSVEAKRRQSLYSHYLQHCNTKGFVFLETYDLKEYDPFLLNIKKPHEFEDVKGSLHLQLHQRQKEKRTARSYEAGCKYTRRQVHRLPQSFHALSESMTSRASTLQKVSSSYPASPCRKTPAADKTETRKSSRRDIIPYHIREAATSDGRCHQSGCSFSTCGTLQQLRSFPAFK